MKLKSVLSVVLLALVSVLSSTLLADDVKVVKKGSQVVIANGLAQINFDLETGQYSGRNVITDKIMFSKASFRLDPGRRCWRNPKTTYTFEQQKTNDALGTGIMLKIFNRPEKSYDPIRILTIKLYNDKTFVVLGFGVKNEFGYDVRVSRAEVLYNGELFVGQQINDPKVLRGGAGAERNIVEDTWKIEALNSAMLTYKDGNERRTIVAGGLKYKEYIRSIEFADGVKRYNNQGSYSRNAGRKQITLTIWDPQGKIVKADSCWYATDSVYIDFVTVDPFEALEAFGLAMRKANNVHPNTYDFPTLCGWMVSTARFGEGKPINNSPGLVKQVEIAQRSGILKYTPVAVRLEPDAYCYANQGNTQQGWWDDQHWAMYKRSLRKPYETFEKFCTAVKSYGGIVFTYFQASLPSNDFAVAHPGWMLNNDISRLHEDHAHHMPIVRYDYSDPGFQRYVLKMWQRLRHDGVQGIKFDYPETAWAKYGGFEDKSYTTSSAYRKLFELCREGLGDDAFIHERALGGPVHESVPCVDLTAGVVDLQRVWSDSSHFEPEMASRIGLRWYKSRVVFSYYPDGKSLYKPRTKEPLPAYQRRTLLTLIGMLSGRLELGTSFGSMTKDMLHDVSRLYPMISEPRSPRPVDMFMGKKDPEVYVYKINDQWSQIILFNNSKKAKTVTAPMSGNQTDTGSLGLNLNKQYYVYDFWNNAIVGVVDGNAKLSRKLKGNEALVYSVHEKLNHPQFISTNRHITQGLMELHNVKWDSNAKVYSGIADVVGGETMEIVIATNGYNIKGVKVNCGTAKITKNTDGLIVLKIKTENNQKT